MITLEQAKQYLASVGINVPDFILEAFLDTSNSIWECLEANYTPATALLIQAYLIGLMSLAQGDRYISSQSSPSGASRSFRYLGFADRWRGTLSLLRSLDKHNCTAGLIPQDPTNRTHGYIGIAKGCCHE